MAMPRERFIDAVEERPVISQSVGPVVSWGGVLGGLFVGAGVVLLLGVLGVAMETTIVPDPPGDLASRLGIAASMWAGVSVLIGFFLAGMVAARATNRPDHAAAVIQGTLVWIVGVLVVLGLVVSGISARATGLLQGVGLLTRGVIAPSPSTTSATTPDDAARALDDLRARVAPLRDDSARLAAEVQAFFAQYPERARSEDPSGAVATQRHSRLGWWITLGALLLTLLVAVGGALTGSPAPPYD